MNRIFYFYPHCHLECTDKEILAFDTLSKKYVFSKKNPFLHYDKESFHRGYLRLSGSLEDFICQCLAKELGYFIDYAETPPFMHNRELEFVTSLSKERKGLGYNLQSYTNSLLREVTINLNNSKDTYSSEMYLQMEYPQYNNDIIDIEHILQQLSAFQSIECIILSGELNISSLCIVLEYAQERNIHVIHRLFGDSAQINKILNLIGEYRNLSVEILVDKSIDLEKLRFTANDQIYVKAIVKSINDVGMFERLNNLMILPVMSFANKNEDILHQMIISEEDILNSSNSIEDCRLSDYINSNEYGHLTIDSDGSVSCLGKRFASIHDTDLSSTVNLWVSKENCLWYYTRKKKNTCKDCALQCLCPPISIYEMLGFFKCPCKL
jgi:pseudo-rSAM protein